VHEGLSFRTASEDDLERLVDVHSAAFPDLRSREVRLRNFTQNPLGDRSDLWVAVTVAPEVVVAHAFLFRLKAWFGGVLVPMGGIASVGVAPEARRRGVGSALIGHLHAVSFERGDVLTVLYPFRQSFYARMGYVTTSNYRRLRVSPASIPWSAERSARAAVGADRPALQACWNAAGARRSGTLARGERLWEARLADERRMFFVVEGAGGVEGYLAWTLEQGERPTATALLVREMASTTDAAYRSLWGLVAAQRGQVSEVRAELAADDALERALVDADRARFGDEHVEHAIGEVAAGPMVRLLDTKRALEARGYRAEGSVALGVGEEVVDVAVLGGRARVTPCAGQPSLQMDSAALAAIAFGALPATHAARLGWVMARDPVALALADELFSLPPYFSPDPF
jgi:predicted acetyltransferase